MNFRAIFLSMQRVLGIFSRRENDVVELIKQDPSSLSPFAQIVGDQKYTVPDHPNLEVLKFIEYPTRPAGIQTFNEQSILSLYRDKLHSISGFAPIFPDTCYHLTHYWPAAADIPV
ncbi:hypothetical protein, partial [Escherichia coli]|uniref:hypothetical protein n=2 Tax=Enterobacteriaceae TaxID=543 RepID=UPI00215771A4